MIGKFSSIIIRFNDKAVISNIRKLKNFTKNNPKLECNGRFKLRIYCRYTVTVSELHTRERIPVVLSLLLMDDVFYFSLYLLF